MCVCMCVCARARVYYVFGLVQRQVPCCPPCPPKQPGKLFLFKLLGPGGKRPALLAASQVKEVRQSNRVETPKLGSCGLDR